MNQVRAEKRAAEQGPESWPRDRARGEAKVIEEPGSTVEEPAIAKRRKELPKAPAKAEAAKAAESPRATAAAAAEEKESPKVPNMLLAAKEKKMAKAPSQEEAEQLRRRDEEVDNWYKEVRWRPDFVDKRSSPLITSSAIWTAVDEVFSSKG